MEEALGCLSHKRRLPLKTSLEFRERFGIEVEELDEYAEHAPVLAGTAQRQDGGKDYQREDLNLSSSRRVLGICMDVADCGCSATRARQLPSF